MLVGARHVCASCALRGFLPRCPRCGRARVDLGEAPGLRTLEAAWPLAAAWRDGQLFLSPFAIRHARRVLGVAAAMSLVVVIGSPLSALSHGAGPLEALVRAEIMMLLWLRRPKNPVTELQSPRTTALPLPEKVIENGLSD